MKVKTFLPVFVLLLAMLACGTTTSGSQQIPPIGSVPLEPSATPFIAESYPTAQAQAISGGQSVSGIDVRVERAWQDGKQVYAEVCFTLPDASDWTIWEASLKYGETISQEFGATLSRIQEGQPVLRCDVLEFYVPPDADLSAVTVIVGKIAAFPRQEDYCTIYMPKIQQVLNERGTGITLGCSDVNGVQTMQIVGKPETMSQEDAEQIVFNDEFFAIQGPWEFTFNLGQ